MASVTGTNPPPPTPWRARPTTAPVRSWADAVTSDPKANTRRHPAKTGARPRMSESRPSSGSSAT